MEWRGASTADHQEPGAGAALGMSDGSVMKAAATARVDLKVMDHQQQQQRFRQEAMRDSLLASRDKHTQQPQRWYGLDWLRFLCIFYVVFGHSYKVSQYGAGGWRDKDEQVEDGRYIFTAVSLGYHWCVPMLFFISGTCMSIGINSHLSKEREKKRALSFFRSSPISAGERILDYFRLAASSCLKLSQFLCLGIICNFINCQVAPTEWGGKQSPIYNPKLKPETEWEYRIRFLAWLLDLDPEKGGFVRAGLFGLIGSQWYTVILMAFIAPTLPLVMWLKDGSELTQRSRVLGVLAVLVGLSTTALLYLPGMSGMNMAYIQVALFGPLFLLMLSLCWPHRFNLKWGFLAFVLLSWGLSIPMPKPKELFFLQFFIFFVAGFYAGEFKSRLFDESNVFFLFKDLNMLLPFAVFVLWNVFPILFESLLSSIRGPYPIHKTLSRRFGSMVGTWVIVIFLFSAASRFFNAPIPRVFYDQLYVWGLLLFVSHTLILTLLWKYLWIPMGFNLEERFFLGCHLTIIITFILVKLYASLRQMVTKMKPKS